MGNIAPFYVGQRVVAIRDHSQGVFKKGYEFTVTDVYKMPCCEAWAITIGIFHRSRITSCQLCHTVGLILKKEWGFGAIAFAPIQENFQSISLSKILEEETKLIGVN